PSGRRWPGWPPATRRARRLTSAPTPSSGSPTPPPPATSRDPRFAPAHPAPPLTAAAAWRPRRRCLLRPSGVRGAPTWRSLGTLGSGGWGRWRIETDAATVRRADGRHPRRLLDRGRADLRRRPVVDPHPA